MFHRLGLVRISVLLGGWTLIHPATAIRDELFEAAVKAVLQDISGPLRIDPRPVNLTRRFYPTEADYHYPETSSVTTARLAILTELGITPTKSLPLIANCTGLLTTPPYRNVSGCPDSHPLVAMFDLPRRHEKRDALAIRGFLLSYDRSGRSARAFDVILTRADDEWVAEIEDLIYID